MDKIKELENEISILKIRLAQLEKHYHLYTKMTYQRDGNDIGYMFRPDETYKFLTIEQYFKYQKEE